MGWWVSALHRRLWWWVSFFFPFSFFLFYRRVAVEQPNVGAHDQHARRPENGGKRHVFRIPAAGQAHDLVQRRHAGGVDRRPLAAQVGQRAVDLQPVGARRLDGQARYRSRAARRRWHWGR
ncbi:MAG: hypothetical protein H7273_02215 [Polaromonas sp.]|nr:hypothetical protein [Polaromonas sp.]